MLWVCFIVDKLVPTPLYPVTVPAVLSDDTLGLELQGKLQAEQEVAGKKQGHCGHHHIGLCTNRMSSTKGSSQQSGKLAGGGQFVGP